MGRPVLTSFLVLANAYIRGVPNEFTGNLPEVVGNAALLVDPGDADALCAAMLTLAESDEIRAELGRLGLERATEFTWEKCAEKTTQAYYAAVNERLGPDKGTGAQLARVHSSRNHSLIVAAAFTFITFPRNTYDDPVDAIAPCKLP